MYNDTILRDGVAEASSMACAGLASAIEAAAMLAEESRQVLPLERVRPM